MTTSSKRSRWSDMYPGFPTAKAIRLLHGAPASARVSLYRYAPGEESRGRSRSARFYVLAGSCIVRAPDDLVLREGDILELAGGDYSLKADDELGATCVWAWELPEEFRTKVAPGRE